MMITAQNISKVYVQGDTSVRAVNQVSLDIQPGEFVVIMGKSGSGKLPYLREYYYSSAIRPLNP